MFFVILFVVLLIVGYVLERIGQVEVVVWSTVFFMLVILLRNERMSMLAFFVLTGILSALLSIRIGVASQRVPSGSVDRFL